MIQLQKLNVNIDGKKICENLSLDIEKGSAVIIQGGNGSGKTSFVNCLIGKEEPSSGKILVDQHDLHRLTKEEKKQFLESTGIALQHLQIRPLDSIRKALNIKSSDKEKIFEILDFLALAERKNCLTKNLSDGELKMLDLVRSLANDPTLLVWDEPFTGIDQSNREKFEVILLKLKAKGTTLIIATIDAKVFEFLKPEKIIEL